MDSDAADSHLPTANRGGGGGATPADSGADASVRLAGRTSSTQLGAGKNIVIQVLYGIAAIGGYFKFEHSFLCKTQYFRFRLLQLFE